MQNNNAKNANNTATAAAAALTNAHAAQAVANNSAAQQVAAQQATAAAANTFAAFVAAQQQTAASAFTTYASKTALLASNSAFAKAHANSALLQHLAAAKNLFSFAAHNSNKYLVIVLYYNNTKQYAYMYVNCTTLAYTSCASVKAAKQAVLAAVAASSTNA